MWTGVIKYGFESAGPNVKALGKSVQTTFWTHCICGTVHTDKTDNQM